MSKHFTVTYNSVAEGKTLKQSVDAKGFYVEAGFVVFIDDNNDNVCAFPSGSVDSVKCDANCDGRKPQREPLRG